MAKKQEKSTTDKSSPVIWEITKKNGNVIKRNDLTADAIKNYENKGCKVKKAGE